MGMAGIIPADPLGARAPCFLKTGEIVLPDAFFLQTPKEAFNNTVLFRRVRRDKRLCRFIVTACFTEKSALEHKAVITTDNRHSFVQALSERLTPGTRHILTYGSPGQRFLSVTPKAIMSYWRRVFNGEQYPYYAGSDLGRSLSGA